jgi:hypothetical protein
MVRSDEVGRIREGDLEVFRRTMPSSSSGKSSTVSGWTPKVVSSATTTYRLRSQLAKT